ncbi:HIT family protein [Candidatus Protochlamydia phocaeensis]|uniref:HIT family protein n=1 Tax=Candidatus Protochlamydia phocaeensis TaxID=1414722 RepID=UPI00083884C8|nr:HIT domain-containing protein [Candidatus Protochlamydia phocaeensis]
MSTISSVQNCPFCVDNPRGLQIIHNQVLFQTHNWTVVFDHKPMTKGHLIALPTLHHDTRFDLTREETADFYEVQQRIQRIYRHVFGHDACLFYDKNRLGIPHFQIHVMPATSIWQLIWLQVKLFFRSFPIPVWTLSPQRLQELRQEFTVPEMQEGYSPLHCCEEHSTAET